MSTKRIFVSIDLPEEVKGQIKQIHNQKIYTIKWMEPKNLHITLNFLGDLTQKQIDDAVEAIAQVVLEHSAFDLVFNKLIPKRYMLWLVPQRNDNLLDLKDDITARLDELGIVKREHQRYTPHVLIAKTRSIKRRMKFKADDFKPIEFKVSSISLYESQLTPGSATHTLIKQFPLS